MNMKINKNLTIMGLLTIVTLSLVGCGKAGNEYDQDNFLPNGTEDNPYRIVKEPVTINIFAPHSSGNPAYADLTMFKHLSEVTGLNFSFNTPDTSAYVNQRAAIWEVGSRVPDLFLFNNAVSEQVQFMENKYNAYVPFNDDNYSYRVSGHTINVGNLIKNYMPNYKEGLENNFGIDLAKEDAVAIATLSDGKMYSALSVKDVPRDLTYKMFINQQWIDNLNNFYGLGLPNADEIKTIEQYLSVLRAFKQYDANDNGDPNDEIPLSSKALEFLRNFILASYGYVSQGAEITEDGKMYSALSVKDVPRDLTYKMFINQQWIDNLNNFYGLGLPNADEIKTIEQYLSVLRAFKQYDANDNGDPNDEIPLSSKALEFLRNFILASYGYVSQGAEITEDGSAFVYVPYQEAYRKYLQTLNTLWKEEILHNSTFSITTDNQLATYGNKNRLGSFVSAAAYLTVGYANEKDYVTFGPLTSSYYTGTPLHLGFGSFIPDGAVITQSSIYPREVARLLDIMYSDLGAQLISYGVEGQDWTWDDDSKTSWTFNVPSSWSGNQEQYRATITPNVGSASALYWSNSFVGKMNDEIITSLNRMSEIYVPYLKNPEPYEIKMNSKEYAEITRIKAALDPQLKYLEASYVRGDDGADPFNEASWESFKSKLSGYGADILINNYNNALLRYKESKS